MAQLLAARGNFYPDLTSYPYLVSNYPPLFIGLTALGQQAFGPSLAFPRALAFLASLGLLLVLFLVLRRMLERATALALAACFAMPWFVTTWAALARVDTLAILLSLAGLGIVLRHGETRRAWPALPLFWLAFFTKQNALLAPLAVLLHLALGRDRRTLPAGVAYAGPLAALFGLLVLATRGGAWRHLVPYTAAAAYEPGRMAESYLEFAVIASPLLLLIALAVWLRPGAFVSGPASPERGEGAASGERASAVRAPDAGNGRILLLYFLLNFASLATIAKAGAAQNYFIEPWLATVLLAGHALRVQGEVSPLHVRWRFAWLLAAAAVSNYAYPSHDRLPQALRAPQNAHEFTTLTQMIRETPGDILSENLSLLVVNRRPVLVEPFGVLLLANDGLFDPAPIVADCERGRFSLVVSEHRLAEIPGLGECLDSRYRVVADLGPYRALRPLPLGAAAPGQ